ncbi:MAG: TY-Chap domain-containing protein [Thermoflexus sp.]
MKASTREQRLLLFAHHLEELCNAPPGSALVFEIPGRPLAYVQFERTSEGLKGEVGSGDWGPRKKARPLPPTALDRLRAMGWQVPSSLRERNPSKTFPSGDPQAIALEIEQIFLEVYRCPPDYTVRTEGVLRGPLK